MLRDRLTITQPKSLFYPAAGGLGWGPPAAIGLGLGRPERPVIALITEYAHRGMTSEVPRLVEIHQR